MTKRKPTTPEQMITAMKKSFEIELNKVRREERLQQRLFGVNHGARIVLVALLEAGAFSDDVRDHVRAWIEDGGVSHFGINGVSIVPPEYP